MAEIKIERRSLPDRLRYFAARLLEGADSSAVAIGLEMTAAELEALPGIIAARLLEQAIADWETDDGLCLEIYADDAEAAVRKALDLPSSNEGTG
jgi:hypothetical protein